MRLRTAAFVVLLTFATLPTHAQQPEAIPAPPANDADVDGLFVSPVTDTKPVDSTVDSKVTADDSVGLGSILLEAGTAEDSNTLSTDKSDDTLTLDPISLSDSQTLDLSFGETISSTIDGIEAPTNNDPIAYETVDPIVSDSGSVVSGSIVSGAIVAEDPFNQPQVIQMPQVESVPQTVYSSPVVQSPAQMTYSSPAPTYSQSYSNVQPTYSVAPQQPVYQQRTYQRPVYRQPVNRQVVTQQAPQPRRMTMTLTETTTYRSPVAVRQATYYQRVPQAAAYPQAVMVSPAGYQAVIAQPRPRALLYGGPVAVVPAQVIGGPVLGPAGQVPMPRAFVPGQPIRNFVRGIGPY